MDVHVYVTTQCKMSGCLSQQHTCVVRATELSTSGCVSIFNASVFFRFILGEKQVGGCDGDLEEEVRGAVGGEGGTGAADTDAGG